METIEWNSSINLTEKYQQECDEIETLMERKLKAESRIFELIIERDKELRAEGERAEELMEERK